MSRLGYRWSFMGPFETIDLSAPGGVNDYTRRLGPLYHRIAQSRRDPQPWPAELVERVRGERRHALPQADLVRRSTWRDRRPDGTDRLSAEAAGGVTVR